MRWTPNRTVRSFRTCSRPQQESDLWIGQGSLLRSLMGAFLRASVILPALWRVLAVRRLPKEWKTPSCAAGLSSLVCLCTVGSARTRDNFQASRRKHFDNWSYRDTERLAGRTRDSRDPVKAIGRCGCGASKPYPPEFIAPLAASCYDATPIFSRSSPPDGGSAKSTVGKVEV
jgi:hypothetical protein